MRETRYPTDWQNTVLGDICYINKNSLSEKTPENYMFRYIDLSSVDKGVIKCTDRYIAFKDAPCRARRIIHKNDIIMSTVRPNLQSFAFIDFDPVDVICSTGFAVLTAKQQMCNKYIYQLLYSKEIETQINNMLVGSNYPAINSSDVASLKVCIPPFAEQEKIAEILGTWDRAIEELTDLIAEKKELKRGLMQRLLTGTQRLPGFSKPWQESKLEALLNLVSIRNKELKIKTVLSVTNNRGFVLPEEHFARAVASEDLSGYKIIKRGDFAYNPSRLNVGSIDRLDSYDEGVLSPMYVVFKCNEKLYSDYMKHWVTTVEFNTKVRNSAQGSVRETVDFKTLSSIKIFLPTDLEEQKAIADVLSKADSEIDLLNQQLDLLKEQKRGLMQKLLTGEVRVKVDVE